MYDFMQDCTTIFSKQIKIINDTIIQNDIILKMSLVHWEWFTTKSDVVMPHVPEQQVDWNLMLYSKIKQNI